MDIFSEILLTIVSAIFFGALLLVLARHIAVPAIVPLLIGGILLGPEGFGIINTAVLGENLRIVISLCVAIILFEGGMTLHPKGLQKASGIIAKLLTIGVLITWFATAAAVYFIFGYSLELALLAGSLIIVTGPTVITPLLKRLNVKEELSHILHWEGVLIDPIGVFVAVLCYEWISVDSTALTHFGQFGLRLAVGLVFGGICGKAIQWMLDREWVPEEQTNIFVLAAALALFGLSDAIVHESGLLSVVIAGLVLGWQQETPRLKNLLQFKSELTEIAIGFLFVLLAANLKLNTFAQFGTKGILLLAIILFVIRPLNVIASTIGSGMKWQDRAFLSWIAPRGIVAGSMASLFALELRAMGNVDADFLEAFTFSVIGATVILQGLSGGFIARLLGLKAKEKTAWLIVGAHLFSRKIADFVAKTGGNECIFVDTNIEAVEEVRTAQYRAVHGNARSIESLPPDIVSRVGTVLALTDNRDSNQLICDRWGERVDKERLFRWTPENTELEGQIGGIGIPVWSMLAKPSMVAYNLKHRESILRQISITDSQAVPNHDGIPLIKMGAQKPVLTDVKLSDNEEAEILVFEHIAHYLPASLKVSHICLLEEDSYSAVIKTLFRRACEISPVLQESENDLLPALLAREEVMHTVLSNGVAVPHFHSGSIREPICVICRLSIGIPLEAHDGKLTKLFFLLLSCSGDPEMHLILMAEIARMASDEQIIECLLNADSEAEILQYLLASSSLGQSITK